MKKPKPKRIELAPQDKIEQYYALAVDFFKSILNMNYDECFVSDESRLSDFANMFDSKTDIAKFIKRIKKRYDVSIDDLTLIKIFDKISTEGKFTEKP